jgi:hypothetical protein
MGKIILTFLLLISSVCFLNAQYWSAVGEGIYGGIYSSGVHYSSAVYNGELYIGGSFDTVGGVPIKNIAKWNGTSWLPVGSGIQSYPSNGSFVLSLKVYNGELYAGGLFDTAGGVPVKNIAKWNGTNWSPVGTGITSSAMDQPVYSIIVHNGILYAAGHFDTAGGIPARNIAKWDGINWSAIGTGTNGRISALFSYNGSVYAGGYFTVAGGNAALNIAKWDGLNWSPLGTGINDYGVSCLAAYNNALYAGGWFTAAGGVAARGIAKWDGMNWSSIGNETAANGVGMPVNSMVVYTGDLYIGGSLTAQHECIAKWNGTNWSGLGLGVYGHVYALISSDTSLYAGGWFQTVNGYNIQANKIARWNDSCSAAPMMNGSIIGNDTICQNSSQTYFINEIPGATSYTWIIPSGWAGTSTANSITLAAGTSGGVISVMANNSCGVSNAQSLPITLDQVVPDDPGPINGDSVVCENTLHTYSIEPVQGATRYIWTLPPGWTGSSTTNSITTTAAANGGVISVIASNNCGNSGTQALSVTTRLNPALPGPISGADDICAGSTETYSITPVMGASYYTWVLPSGWSGYSTSNSISVLAGINSGMLSVTASNNCGTTIPQTVVITSITIPATPALITGNDTVCEGSSQSYFVDTVTGATGYAWESTFGWVSSVDANSATIVVDQISMFGDFIAVGAYNNCGYSDAMILPVIVRSLPHYPNWIAGNQIICRGSTQTYFINPIYGATSYTWILPPGWTGNSTTSSINVAAGNEPGEISVLANNSCGSRASPSLPIWLDTIPSKPGDITGNVYVNPGQTQSYSINNGVPGYNWSLSGGGNIITGQNTRKINVSWQTPGSYVLSASVTNSCGTGADQSLTIKVSAANIEDPYSLQLYPNPSSGQFFLKAKRVQDKVINVDVVNMAGQLIFRSGKRQGANDYTRAINLDKMAVGLYAVRIMIDDKTYVRSVMIRH